MPRDIKIGSAVKGLRRNGSERRTSRESTSSSEMTQSANLPEPFPSAPLIVPPPHIPFTGRKFSLAHDPNVSHPKPNVPPARYYNMVLNQGKVKSVMSGDSVVLCAIDNPERERTLSLAFCSAPHLRKDGDEPWAFQSRDALRKLLVGKNVQFSVLYAIPNTKREYGIIYLMDGHKLPEDMVKEGWLKLRDDAGKKEDTEEAIAQIEKLRQYETAARNEEKGLWAKASGKIDVQHDLGDSKEFLETWKGKSVDGIVERVLSGDRMLVRLILSPESHIQVMTLVAGIRAPTTERVNPSSGQTQPAEEHGNEARAFVEARLLQRNVKVDILGVSPQNQLIASVKHPRGSIATFLLEAGLARCTDHHSTMLGAGMADLRAAEKTAQGSKRGLFKDHVAKSAGSGGNLEATVTKIFSADVVYLQNRAGVEKRINISSIRGPRPNEAAESPFRDEAKEFLRKKIIGKKVRMSIDGTRPASGEYEAKEVATLSLNDKNIGLLLVQEGWASVIRHRITDTDRAPNYDELLAAQEVAKEEKKGMWSGKPSKAKQFVDASENIQKAKLNLSGLQRQKKIPAIVDFVKAGSRFNVLIPRENIKLNFILGGIKAPKSARNPTEKSEPFGQECHDLASKRLTQRDVEIDVHNVDKHGGFIGELYINKESFAKILVEEGFAEVHQFSAEQAGNASELNAALQRAKEGRKGQWAEWDPSQDLPQEDQVDNSTEETGNDSLISKPKDWREVIVTNIDEAGKLKVQIIGTGTDALTTLASAFNSFHMNSSNSQGLPGPPKAGDFVAAKFTGDGQWYRARVRANDRNAKESEIVYIDYGNGEKMPWSKLRPLSQPQFSVQKLRGQAVDAVFSLVQFPSSTQHYMDDALEYLNLNVLERKFVVNVDNAAPDGTLHLTLYDGKNSSDLTDSINGDIIRDGYAMVPTKLKAWERSLGDVLKFLRAKQAEASHDRLGMWKYGDLTED